MEAGNQTAADPPVLCQPLTLLPVGHILLEMLEVEVPGAAARVHTEINHNLS